MSKRYKTTINLLRRTVEMLEARRNGTLWYVNPKEHPLPTLPNEIYLKGEYLVELAKSNPKLVGEAIKLIRDIEDVEERISREGRGRRKEG